jgi:hypothetical protein
MEEPPPPPCTHSCVPRAPMNWVGPMAFWEDLGTAVVPGCPAGFNDPMPADVHHGLVAPDGECLCTCGPAEGQVCETTMRIFLDQACGNACATLGTRPCAQVPAACTGSQGTTSIDALTISGGSCRPQVDPPATPTWNYNERLCKSSDGGGSCDDPKQVCARTPDFPFYSTLCVTQQIAQGDPLPACPSGYPKPASGALYGKYTDNRRCSECKCGAPTGGICTGKINIYGGNDCNATPLGSFTLGTSNFCQKFDLGMGALHPTHITGQMTTSPAGTCSVTTQSAPTGEATESGPVTVVCCQANK